MCRCAHRTFVSLCLFAGFGCTNAGEGPPAARLNFPIAVAISPDGSQLYVANSNFDLRYNAGSLQSYNLETLNNSLPDCTGLPRARRQECGVIPIEDTDPGDLPDTIVPTAGLLTGEVLIGSYADGLVISPRGDRLYLPIRSDANLTFVDVDGGQLFCGGNGRHECSSEFRRGVDEGATLRGIELPADPVGVAVGALSDLGIDTGDDDGDYILMAHRGGRVSLFLDEPTPSSSAPPAGADKPRLVHTLSGFPAELIDLTVDPTTGLAWVTNSGDAVVSRAGMAIDPTDRERSFLFDAGSLAVRDVDTGSANVADSRVIRFDPRPDVRRAYVLSRLPRALLSVDVGASETRVELASVVPVGVGPLPTRGQ